MSPVHALRRHGIRRQPNLQRSRSARAGWQAHAELIAQYLHHRIGMRQFAALALTGVQSHLRGNISSKRL
jgi:hypothetical protein